MAEQVTSKTKNEGRIAAGKRRDEWNRKNKNNLLKNKDQEPTSHTSSAWYCGGAAIVFGFCLALYFYQRKKPALAPVSTRVDDIFRMN